jgi:hypothetical protein
MNAGLAFAVVRHDESGHESGHEKGYKARDEFLFQISNHPAL